MNSGLVSLIQIILDHLFKQSFFKKQINPHHGDFDLLVISVWFSMQGILSSNNSNISHGAAVLEWDVRRNFRAMSSYTLLTMAWNSPVAPQSSQGHAIAHTSEKVPHCGLLVFGTVSIHGKLTPCLELLHHHCYPKQKCTLLSSLKPMEASLV